MSCPMRVPRVVRQCRAARDAAVDQRPLCRHLPVGQLHRQVDDTLAPGQELRLGDYPMLPGANDAGLLYRPAMLLAVNARTEHPKEAALLLDFLLNDPASVSAMGLKRGVPVSDKAVAQLLRAGVPGGLAVEGMSQVEALPHAVHESAYFEHARVRDAFIDTFELLCLRRDRRRQCRPAPARRRQSHPRTGDPLTWARPWRRKFCMSPIDGVTLEISNGAALSLAMRRTCSSLDGTEVLRSVDNVVTLAGLAGGRDYRVVDPVGRPGDRPALPHAGNGDAPRCPRRSARSAMACTTTPRPCKRRSAVVRRAAPWCFPAGIWLSGPLFLKSTMRLHLERARACSGIRHDRRWPLLPGTLPPDGWPDPVLGTWEGRPATCHASLLNRHRGGRCRRSMAKA